MITIEGMVSKTCSLTIVVTLRLLFYPWRSCSHLIIGVRDSPLFILDIRCIYVCFLYHSWRCCRIFASFLLLILVIPSIALFLARLGTSMVCYFRAFTAIGFFQQLHRTFFAEAGYAPILLPLRLEVSFLLSPLVWGCLSKVRVWLLLFSICCVWYCDLLCWRYGALKRIYQHHVSNE